MRNLLEQLDRMKQLMVYEKGSPINEISTNVAGSAQLKQKSNKKDDEEKKEGSENKTVLPEENCRKITKTEPFSVDITEGDGAKKFVEFFGEELNKEYGKLEKGGKLYLKSAKVFGGASNYYNKKGTKPDYCNNYDETVGTASLKEWSSECEGFGTDGATRYTYEDGYKYNEKKSEERAKNVLQKVREGIIEGAEKMGIELPNGFDSQDIEYLHGTIYTGDKADEKKATSKLPDGQNGQIVMIDAIVCYVPPGECEGCKKRVDGECKCREEDGLKDDGSGNCVCIDTNKPPNENCQCVVERGCPKCQEKDENDDCKCKPGLKEIDDPENEGQKKCVCDDGSDPDDDCGCENKKKECPTCQELDEETDKCRCQKGLKEETDDEGNIKCVCPNEGEELIKSGAKCECKKQPKPPECNQTYEIKGGRGTKPYNFVTKAFQRKWPFEGTGQVTISFNPLVVPDAFYVKYGEQEFWSGFVGDVYKMGDGLYKMSSVPRNQKERFYKDIFPSKITSENDTSIVDRYPRNFAGELVWYKQNDGLLESINAEISKVGGTPINNIFKNGDGNAEKITNGIKNTKTKLKDIYDSYGNVLKGDTSFNLKKERGEEENIIIIVFSPLSETLFKMKIECK